MGDASATDKLSTSTHIPAASSKTDLHPNEVSDISTVPTTGTSKRPRTEPDAGRGGENEFSATPQGKITIQHDVLKGSDAAEMVSKWCISLCDILQSCSSQQQDIAELSAANESIRKQIEATRKRVDARRKFVVADREPTATGLSKQKTRQNELAQVQEELDKLARECQEAEEEQRREFDEVRRLLDRD